MNPKSRKAIFAKVGNKRMIVTDNHIVHDAVPVRRFNIIINAVNNETGSLAKPIETTIDATSKSDAIKKIKHLEQNIPNISNKGIQFGNEIKLEKNRHFYGRVESRKTT